MIVKDMALVYMYTYYMYMLLLKKIISKVVRGQNVKSAKCKQNKTSFVWFIVHMYTWHGISVMILNHS